MCRVFWSYAKNMYEKSGFNETANLDIIQILTVYECEGGNMSTQI